MTPALEPTTPPPISEPAHPPLAHPPLDLDRDFDFDSTIQARDAQVDHSPELYLRVVANPFLGLSAFLVWLAAMKAVILDGVAGLLAPIAVLVLLPCLALIPGRFQYHCLDCGRTGKLSQWSRHVCPRVVERRLEGRVRRVRGPSPTVQVILWLWLLMALAVGLQAWSAPW